MPYSPQRWQKLGPTETHRVRGCGLTLCWVIDTGRSHAEAELPVFAEEPEQLARLHILTSQYVNFA